MIFTEFRLGNSASISCSPGGFAVQTRARTQLVAGFDEIVRIAIYERDEITTDLVCFEVALEGGDEITLHEEMPGFDHWAKSLEQLPGFDANWRDGVIHPPFATNEIVACSRTPHEETQ
jgi:hypothetical protein